eukprot:5600877-Alexandrium_andersonii.AAC.1
MLPKGRLLAQTPLWRAGLSRPSTKSPSSPMPGEGRIYPGRRSQPVGSLPQHVPAGGRADSHCRACLSQVGYARCHLCAGQLRTRLAANCQAGQ